VLLALAMKRQLPSITALECFERVIRHGLVTRAAEELNLTQSAVSRQIGNLEAFTRQQLFLRERKRLIPTPAALQFAASLSITLDTLERETMRLMSSGAEDLILTLGLLPTFGSRWLIPKLGSFTEKYPDIQLNIVTGLNIADFTAARADVAIVYGDGIFPGFESYRILDEHIVPVIAPDHYDDPDILKYEHLQMATRPTAWPDWLHAQFGRDVTQRLGPKFENFTMLIAAVRSGLGVAVLPVMYVGADLEKGRMIAPFGPAVTSRRGYYLACAEHLAEAPKVKAFRDWIFSKARDGLHPKP